MLQEKRTLTDTRGLLVVGCPRSGTTLLQSLLACSPDVVTFRETRLFTSVLALRKGFFIPSRSPANEAKRFLAENDLDASAPLPSGGHLFPTARAAWMLGVLDLAAEQRGGGVWLEKTPRHLLYVPLILRAAQKRGQRIDVVHLVRDGVSTAASLVQASKLSAKTWRQAYSAEQALARWQRDLKISRDYIGQDGHHFACYEDLVDAPETAILALAKRLDLSLNEEDLKQRQEKATQVIRPDEKWKALNTGAIQKTSRTKEHLSAEQLAGLEKAIDRSDYELIRKAAAS